MKVAVVFGSRLLDGKAREGGMPLISILGIKF